MLTGDTSSGIDGSHCPVRFRLVLLLLAVPCAAVSQEPQAPLEDLAPLVGTWCSELDPRYHDHPMVRRFNPELQSHAMVFEWGPERAYVRIRLHQPDYPRQDPGGPYIEGLVLYDAATAEIRMVEYNAQDRLLFRGTYAVQANGDVLRTYVVTYRDGSTGRYREFWRWQDSARTAFDWITEQERDGTWVRGEVIVSWRRAETCSMGDVPPTDGLSGGG